VLNEFGRKLKQARPFYVKDFGGNADNIPPAVNQIGLCADRYFDFKKDSPILAFYWRACALGLPSAA
jgi:hypothetical protein